MADDKMTDKDKITDCEMTADCDMTGKDFDILIAAWLDGRLDAEGSQALQQELRRSATARAKFRRYTELDTRLHELADTSDMLGTAQHIVEAAKQKPSQAIESRSMDSPAANSMDFRRERTQVTLPPTRSNGSGPSAFSRLTFWHAAVAVGMLIAISLFSYFHAGERQTGQTGPVAELGTAEEPAEKLQDSSEASTVSPRKPPAPVATLASAERALWENAQLEIGQALYEGDSISLQEGKARISVGFGAELVADAPCLLTFLASDRVQLHQGNVAVDVAPWAKGFTVVTEEMDIVDLGTTFTVSATPGMKSETTVLKGVVRVHPSNVRNEQRRGLLISEGQRVSSDGKGSFENVPQENIQRLLSSLDFGVTGPYRPVDLNNTGFGLSVGDEDLHWRVVAGPEESFTGPQYASVCVPHEAYLPNEPQKSQWISIADWQTATANSIYTFQAEFNLEGYDLSTMQLFGRFLADNGVSGVRVNGQSVRVQSWVDNVKYQPFRDRQFRFVNVTEGLVEGRNVIEVDVRNGMQRKRDKKANVVKLSPIPNPMALRVEWYAFGRQFSLAKNSDNTKLFPRFREHISPRLTLACKGPEI